MAKNIGVLLDENLELVINPVRDSTGMITSGFVIGDTTFQNQKILLLANKGEMKEYPTCGVGASNYLESNNGDELAREIRSEFTKDGMEVTKIAIDIPSIKIEAKYK